MNFDKIVAKYVKIVNKLTGGYSILLNNENIVTNQFIVFVKGLNSKKSINLILELITTRPFGKILNIDHDYNIYMQNVADEVYYTKMQLILATLNTRYWHFNLPDFNNDLIKNKKASILNEYLNNSVVELVNFIKISKESCSTEMCKATTSLLLIHSNFPQDMTEIKENASNCNNFLSISPSEFINSNFKNVKLIIKLIKYFLYLNNNILKLDLYLIQLGVAEFSASKKKNYLSWRLALGSLLNFQEQHAVSTAYIPNRLWLYEDQSACLQQFWESLLLEFSTEDTRKNLNYSIKFLKISIADNRYEKEHISVFSENKPKALTTSNAAIGPNCSNRPLTEREKKVSQSILRVLSLGLRGELIVFGFSCKFKPIYSRHWNMSIYDEL